MSGIWKKLAIIILLVSVLTVSGYVVYFLQKEKVEVEKVYLNSENIVSNPEGTLTRMIRRNGDIYYIANGMFISEVGLKEGALRGFFRVREDPSEVAVPVLILLNEDTASLVVYPLGFDDSEGDPSPILSSQLIETIKPGMVAELYINTGPKTTTNPSRYWLDDVIAGNWESLRRVTFEASIVGVLENRPNE
ncbi:MAG TPA: hypothetical protein VJ227_04005 [Patescibacteria group bacterium]|nr:hypothetical protein [Patescibacteria group bacterium]